MFSAPVLLKAAIEVGHTHHGIYRLADTSLVFLKSASLEETKNVIKGFQIVPDLLKILREWHKTGNIEKPFTAAVVLLRDIAVELEVASHFELITESENINHRIISNVASVMHIVVMGFVAYHALVKLKGISALSPVASATPLKVHQKKEALSSLATASSKIAQQSFMLLDTDYHNVTKMLTLIFNICAFVSCIFDTKVVRRHHKKRD